MLSLLNLIISLTLIRFITKEDYGLYSQLFVLGLFAFVITDSLVYSPLTTIAPRKSKLIQQQLFVRTHQIQRRLSFLLAIVFGGISAVIVALAHDWVAAIPVGISFALYVFFNAQREYQRTVHFSQRRSSLILKTDGIYVAVVLLCILLLFFINQLSIATVFLVLTCANLTCLILKPPQKKLPDNTSVSAHDVRQELWQRGRWALPGAFIGWFGNYSYLFIAGIFLGITATADLNASRLLLMPISLSVLAWSRVARPIASKLFATQQWRQLRQLTLLSLVGLEAFILCYAAILWLCLPWLQTHVLGPQYLHATSLVLPWAVFFATSTIRLVGTSLLSSNDQYHHMLITSIVAVVTMLIACIILIPMYGSFGAILSLIIVEVIDLILIWGIFIPIAKRQTT